MEGQKLAIAASGKALIFDPSDGTISENTGKSFSEYIESIRDNLLLGKLHYGGVELGLVESAWKTIQYTKYYLFKLKIFQV